MDNAPAQQTRQHNIYLGLILLELIVIIGINLCWIEASSPIFRGDSAKNALNVLTISEDDTDISPLSASPLFYEYCSYFIGMFDEYSNLPFFVIQALFLSIMGFALYYTGKALHSPFTGFIAATLALFSLPSCIALRTFSVNYPIAAILVLIIYLLLKQSRTGNRLYTVYIILAGTALSLVGTHSIIYLVTLLLGYAFSSCYLNRRKPGYIRNALLAICFPLVGILYTITIFPKASFIAIELAIFQALIISGLGLIHFSNSQTEALGFRFCQLGAIGFLTMVCLSICSGGEVTNSCFSDNLSSSSIPLAYDSFGCFLQGLSLWFRGVLIDLKCRSMGQVLFILFVLSLVWLLWRKKHRWSLTPLISCVTLSPILFALSVSNKSSNYYPTTCLACLLIALWIQDWKRWAYLPMALVLSIYLSYSLGWALPLDIPQVNSHFIRSELTRSQKSSHAYVLESYSWRQDNQSMGSWNIIFPPSNQAINLINSLTYWHPNLYFTVKPYHSIWEQYSEQIVELLPKTEHSIIVVHLATAPNPLIPDITTNAEISSTLNFALNLMDHDLELSVVPYSVGILESEPVAQSDSCFVLDISDSSQKTLSILPPLKSRSTMVSCLKRDNLTLKLFRLGLNKNTIIKKQTLREPLSVPQAAQICPENPQTTKP